jgi:putative transposase
LSIRLVCEAFGLSEIGDHYRSVLNAENDRIAGRLVRLTDNQRNCGLGLCFLYLRNVNGHRWNHNRRYRIFCELELNLQVEPKKRMDRRKPEPLTIPATINQVWSTNFARSTR